MSEVFLAEPVNGVSGLPSRLALKRLHPGLAQDPELQQALLDEARICARLKHPGLVRIYEVGEVDGTLFLALELVEGWRLSDLLAAGRASDRAVPWPVAVQLGVQLCAALAHVHAGGLVHRDVNPSNVMVTGAGAVKLLDFGIAKAAQRYQTTQVGARKGTPRYAAPELYTGEALGPSADVWGVGAMLYELLAGRPPFDGSYAHVVHQVVHGAPSPLQGLRGGLSEPVLDAVSRALQRDANARPDAAGMGQLLQIALRDHRDASEQAVAAWAQSLAAPAAQAAAGPHTASLPGAAPAGDEDLSPLTPGARVARYTILHKLAEGGMAEVWLARADGPGGFAKQVALKTVRGAFASSVEFRARFLDEARLAALINHPNVVHIFDVGIDQGRVYLAMEHLEGQTLYSLRRAVGRSAEPLPVAMAARIISECAAGLDFAHRLTDAAGKGLEIVHRDVSAKNVFITRSGQVKVLDFGLATAADSGRFTQAGTLRGTFAYLAPEQIEGGPLTRRVDVWALGINLYELLTGQPPFREAAEVGLLSAIVSEAPPPPSQLRREVPAELDRITLRALQRRPEERYRSAGELRDELEKYLRDQPSISTYDVSAMMQRLFPSAAPEGSSAGGVSTTVSARLPLPQRPRRRWPAVIALAAALAFVVSFGVSHLLRATPEVVVATPAPAIAPPSPAPGPVPPAMPAEVKPGTLEVSCNVPCDVAVDTGPTRAAPFHADDLEPGEHQLKVVSAATAAERSVTVSIHSGETQTRSIAFGKGKLALRVTPWANVRVDGRAAGQTPLPPLVLLEGRHEIELWNPELKVRKRSVIWVRAGDQHELTTRLR